MSEYFFRNVKKVNPFLHFKVFLILVLFARLFFLFDYASFAQEDVNQKSPSAEMIDPLEKIGKGIISKNEVSHKNYSSNSDIDKSKNKEELSALIYNDLLVGYPMEEMVVEISKKDKAVGAFLVSIAKKESDWGKHSPRKNGKDCFNYWGYKGSYNPTDSGYSCFESPEHAVAVVGGRIADLIGKKIDTPERMVVWKCGSDCSWDNPVAVRKWISDVSAYYYKLNS